MAESGNMNLSVKIGGGGYDDFFPYELVLEEGFSRVYKAELTVLTGTLRLQKDLRELMDSNISLAISQRIGGGLVVRSRFLHGIITGVVNFGVIDRGKKTSCYRHVITVEGDLARLRHTRFSHPFYRKTPAGIIEEILAKYNIRGQFAEDYINCSDFSKNLMFEQVNEPDLDFMRHVMELYGLSFSSVYPASKNGLGKADLYFSEGYRFPQPLYEYSDKRKIPGVEKFDFESYDQGRNLWKIDGWRMENRIGVDGLEITAPYPELNYGSREWRFGDSGEGKRYYRYDSLFHGYERGTPPGEIDADIKKIIQARRHSFLLEKQRYAGRAENIVFMPGLIFDLGHFYGPGDNSPITALVTGSRLHVRSLWPGDISSPPADAETGELARLEFSAIDWGKDSEKRFCAPQERR
jgi:uncharacterized protein involved in type VI secretion and phage assembly